jgi:MoxR-like ATPase
MIQSAAKSWAVLEGRNYVNEDDLKTILPYVLLHRLKFHAGAGSPEEALYELALPHFEELARSGLK